MLFARKMLILENYWRWEGRGELVEGSVFGTGVGWEGCCYIASLVVWGEWDAWRQDAGRLPFYGARERWVF